MRMENKGKKIIIRVLMNLRIKQRGNALNETKNSGNIIDKKKNCIWQIKLYSKGISKPLTIYLTKPTYLLPFIPCKMQINFKET